MLDAKKLKKLREKLLKQREKEENNWKKKWFELKPFKTTDDIPDIPKVKDPEEYQEVIVKNLIRCGAIPKDQLEVDAIYEGTCRNADIAMWNGKQFAYRRYKFGQYEDAKINHFEDDNGYDLFVPLSKV